MVDPSVSVTGRTADANAALGHSARAGTPDLILSVVIWLAGLAAIVLIFSQDSVPFYPDQPARR